MFMDDARHLFALVSVRLESQRHETGRRESQVQHFPPFFVVPVEIDIIRIEGIFKDRKPGICFEKGGKIRERAFLYL